MLRLTKGNTENVVLTLAERQTILDANYLFVFTSRMTNEKTKIVVVNSADISTNKSRFNEFELVVNDYFENKEEGFYSYKVYEQESTTNTDEAETGGVLETGVMFLSDGQEVSTTKYNNTTTYKFYDAE